MPAWDNRFRKLSFGIGILLLILFAGSGVLLIFFQSSPGKSFLASYLSKALQEEKPHLDLLLPRLWLPRGGPGQFFNPDGLQHAWR